MLVKFGRMGGEVKEYYMGEEGDDDLTIDNLLEIVNIEMGISDVIHISTEPDNKIDDCDTDYELEDGATYILESIQIGSFEKKMIDLLYERGDIGDMTESEQKDFVKEIADLVIKNNWDN